MKVLQLTIDDFATFNGVRGMIKASDFTITKINEKNFNDDLAANLENYISDNQIFADMFNIEYLGYLSGRVGINENEQIIVIKLINTFLKENKIKI